MKKSHRINLLRATLLIGTLVSLFFVPWLLVKAWILPLPDTIEQQLEQAVGHGFDGVVVYVEQAGKAPEFYAAGWHDRDKKKPADPHALYKIASIAKLYDAVAATKLVADGRLSLDKTLAEYLPSLESRIDHANEITLRMMIQHRSGLPNFTDVPNFWAQPTDNFEDSLALILGTPASFAPNADYQYSNTNYLLLNKIVDNALGYDNWKFKKTEILDRLALNNTYRSLADVPDIAAVMSGYHLGYPDDLKYEDHGMHASAEDVGRFLRALNDGSIFDGNEREIYASIYQFEHSGWVPGYQSFALYHAKLDTVVVAFYSTTDPKLYNWNLAQIVNGRVKKIIQSASH